LSPAAKAAPICRPATNALKVKPHYNQFNFDISLRGHKLHANNYDNNNNNNNNNNSP